MRARISGDNLAVVRFCASHGRLTRPHLHGPLDAPLNAVTWAGWQIDWNAVRRRFNRAADSLAMIGRNKAALLLDTNVVAPTWGFLVTERFRSWFLDPYTVVPTGHALGRGWLTSVP